MNLVFDLLLLHYCTMRWQTTLENNLKRIDVVVLFSSTRWHCSMCILFSFQMPLFFKFYLNLYLF